MPQRLNNHISVLDSSTGCGPSTLLRLSHIWCKSGVTDNRNVRSRGADVGDEGVDMLSVFHRMRNVDARADLVHTDRETLDKLGWYGSKPEQVDMFA